MFYEFLDIVNNNTTTPNPIKVQTKRKALERPNSNPKERKVKTNCPAVYDFRTGIIRLLRPAVYGFHAGEFCGKYQPA